MPRVARIVVPGWPHHVTQRGNNRQDVFFVDDDRRVYLKLLKEQAEVYGLAVLGYCLMTNHVHLVAVPAGEQSLAKAVGRTHFLYSQYVNRFHKRSGHLWQNRFYSCVLDETHLWRGLAYVERNPVRARLVRQAWRYEWSSAAAHVGEADQSGLLDLSAWQREWKPGHWQKALVDSDDDKVTELIRASTHSGRPLATDSILSKLEHKLGRRLRSLPVGRPRNADKQADSRKGDDPQPEK